MPDHHRPVFVDPSGRRRRVVRAIAVVGAALTTGYVALVLLAAFGGPGSPAARLPLLPDAPAAADQGPAQPAPAVLAPKPAAGPTPTGAAATVTTAPTSAASTTTTSSHRGRAPTRPSEPPGNGSRPSDPPGNGG